MGYFEHYMTQRRKVIARKYDFRSSRLRRVFGRHLREYPVTEEELTGLREDKMKAIYTCVTILGR